MKDKLRLDYFKLKGGVPCVGDSMVMLNGQVEVVNKAGLPGWVRNSKIDVDWYFSSFSDRENKGEQPVPDDFPVIAHHSIGACVMKARGIAWYENGPRTIELWKPDYDGLLKMQQEHDKKLHNESIKAACDEANKESNMLSEKEKRTILTINHLKGELPGGRGEPRNPYGLYLSDGAIYSSWLTGHYLLLTDYVRLADYYKLIKDKLACNCGCNKESFTCEWHIAQMKHKGVDTSIKELYPARKATALSELAETVAPVYTQEMKDNKTLPSIGMKFFFADGIRVCETVSGVTACYKELDGDLGIAYLDDIMPIKTPEQIEQEKIDKAKVNRRKELHATYIEAFDNDELELMDLLELMEENGHLVEIKK